MTCLGSLSQNLAKLEMYVDVTSKTSSNVAFTYVLKQLSFIKGTSDKYHGKCGNMATVVRKGSQLGEGRRNFQGVKILVEQRGKNLVKY